MLKLALIVCLFSGSAQAHDSLVPHAHPHGVSMLPGVEVIGVAALLLALAVLVIAQFKRR
ncbi:MAG: hypothetical protein HY244_09375 [Rhizobiales bacterium]|nr:hypothetical protein [Hyphomicrobiales bacterium]